MKLETYSDLIQICCATNLKKNSNDQNCPKFRVTHFVNSQQSRHKSPVQWAFIARGHSQRETF